MKNKQNLIVHQVGFTPIESGFTLIELIVAISMIGILIGLTTINLLNSRQKASLNSVITLVGTDINQQQMKAMSGDTEGDSGSNKGIYFELTRYTLFKGAQYSATDPANFTITLDDAVQFTNITFPNAILLFASGSGELVNYATASSTITLRNSINNEGKTIMLNRYGVITQIQ